MVEFSENVQRAMQWWQLRHKHSLPEFVDFSELESVAKSMNMTVPKADIKVAARWLYEFNSILVNPSFQTASVPIRFTWCSTNYGITLSSIRESRRKRSK